MTDARSPGVVVGTMVISWLLDERPSALADAYAISSGRSQFCSPSKP